MMKDRLKSLAILLTLTISILTSLGTIFPTAKATYVEGPISVDTVWTLAESPFIVAQNVTIRRGVTLTIEPGVEVRFGGGPFTIIVNGTLVARGTEEKPIRFTSNKESPEAGDWATIYFNGTGQSPSILENCIIEYGVDGVMVKDGVLTVQKSIIQFNAMSGITILGGSVTVRQTTMQDNKDGVVILGGNTVLQNNTVMLNENGVILQGDLSNSHINVTQNYISSNRNSGVSLLMEKSSSDITIKGNTVSSNLYGFYVATNVTTVITRNYIYNNDIGAFYEQGEKHTIRFNNIWGNVLGIDASPRARVNATQNYWGDKSGPYHESLNPRGKGNPVGGNGVNIDFIFFLTAPIDHKNSPPRAVLWTDKTKVAPGQEVTFVGSYSEDDGRVDKYLFNFGDGHNSTWTTLSLFFHKYSNTGTYTARLTVMDDFEAVSTSPPVTIQVVNLPPLNVELTLSSHSVHRGGEISITVRVSSNSGPMGGANVTIHSVKGGSFSQPSGLTDSSGLFTTTFKAPSTVTDVTNIRIIAKASKEGYADGSSFDYLEVVPPLSVEVSAAPSTVISEELSTINVRVTWSGVPIPEAMVTVSSSAGGTFTETEKLTNLTGEANFTFTAPPVTVETSITIVVHALKASYVEGEGQTVLLVIPKILSLTVVAERRAIISEEEVSVIVNARYGESPVKDVNVTVSADVGGWTSTAATDANGSATFTFKAPPVPMETNITLTAVASKPGYASVANHTLLTVKPGNLTVIVVPSSYWVKPEELVKLTVYVKCANRPIANASVTVSANMGTFSETLALTNASGCCEFSFWAPKTSETVSVTVNVDVEKYGYLAASQSLFLTVSAPSEAGIPWLVILLVLIPVVLAIVFVVLVKTGVISFSFSREQEEE
ncbi:MAG: PKD domain-containing protein [Candidatus Bathyarchaeia archaeon]